MTYKYKIYHMENGKIYLSNGCGHCSEDKIEITEKDIELIKIARIQE